MFNWDFLIFKQIQKYRYELVSIFLTILFLYSLLSCIIYYEISAIITIIIVCSFIAIISFKNPVNGFCIILCLSPLFGNHPGGKYLEIFELLMLLWSAIAMYKTSAQSSGFFIKGLEWAFVFSGLLSLCANPYLLLDIFNYYMNPYFIMSARESQSLYVLKMLITTFLCICISCILFRLLKQIGIDLVIKISKIIFFITAVLLLSGLIEIAFPAFRETLDKCLIFIDNYIDIIGPHPILPFLTKIMPARSIQSVFWNRGWFAIYLVATFPFVLLIIHKKIVTVRKSNQIMIFIVLIIASIVYFSLIGARGAFIAVFSCFFSYGFFLFFGNLNLRWLKKAIPFVLVLIIIIIPAMTNLQMFGKEDINRAELFSRGILVGKANLFFGGGIEGYGWHNMAYLPSICGTNIHGSTHNQVLQVFSGQGIFGLIIYLLVIFFTLRNLLNAIENRQSLAIPVFAGFIGILIYSSFQEWFYLRPVQLLWWLIPLFSGALIKNAKNSET